MKKLITLSAIAFMISGCESFNNIATDTNIGTVIGASNTGSNEEAARAIKEALAQGIAKSVLQLNTQDGFFKDELFKVLLPPDAKKAENKLREIGRAHV